MMFGRIRNKRVQAATVHFLCSGLVAAISAVLVFFLWYPEPFYSIAGGIKLFLILTGVDVVIGPLLTFVVFDKNKTHRQLLLDLGLIASVQLAALAYGLFVLAQARPVVVAAENMMFRVVSFNEIYDQELKFAPSFDIFEAGGPRLVGVRKSVSQEELMTSVGLALQGFDVGTRPSYWTSYDDSRTRVIQQMYPLSKVASALAMDSGEIVAIAEKYGRDVSSLSVLPLQAKQPDWYVLLDSANGRVLGYVELKHKSTR